MNLSVNTLPDVIEALSRFEPSWNVWVGLHIPKSRVKYYGSQLVESSVYSMSD